MNKPKSVADLLYDLKETIEILIQFRGDSILSKYGAIERLRRPTVAILSHQLKQTNVDIYEPLWQLVVRLHSNSQRYIQLLQECYHQENIRLSVEQWIDQSVISQCLSDQMSSLTENVDLFSQFYQRHAFLSFKELSNGFLLCLRTIENDDPSLLAQIDPKLFSKETFQSNFPDELNEKKIKEDEPIIKDEKKIQEKFGHRRIHSAPLFSQKNEEIYHRFSPLKNRFDSEENSTGFGSIDDHSEENLLSSTVLEDSLHTSLSPMKLNRNRINEKQRPMFSSQKAHTLEDFVRQSDLNTRTDVEKENAQLYFCEAILSAIEQLNIDEQCQKDFGQSWSSSIGQFISQCETIRSSSSPSDLLDDSVTDSTAPPNSFTLSQTTSNLEDSSADSIALSLIETLKNTRWPNLGELLWIIEEDIDSQPTLLPIPPGISIDPDGNCSTNSIGKNRNHRGNEDWAPPREQIIVLIHPSPNRQNKLKDQRFRCAGCGRFTEKAFANSFRYCEYTDKYYCKICHSNKQTSLPGYMILKWDFSPKHYVSNFAFNYLSRIRSEPIFNLGDLNQNLFRKSRTLKQVDILRWSLYYFDQYISHCRLAEENKDKLIFKQVPMYIYNNPYIYSIDDLFEIKSGNLLKVLENLAKQLRKHVFTCPICSGQGHICQICQISSDIIFPFDLEKNSVCQVCQSCFHLKCHEKRQFSCPKCPRQSRRNLISSNRTATITDTSSPSLENGKDLIN